MFRAGMTSVQDPLDVLIIGAGAVGTIFASCIHNNPEIRLTFLCRSNYEQVKEHGLEISKRSTGPVAIRPYEVVPTLSSISKRSPFQYVVCANKIIPSGEDYPWIDDLKHLPRNKTTCFVTAQNGILNESLLQQAFPQNPILSAICYACVTRTAPRFVQENLRLQQHCFKVGAFTKSTTSIDHAQKLVGLGGHEFSFIESVEMERWKKLVLNASINTTASLFNANTHVIMEDAHKRAIATRLGQETAAVGKALGVRLDDSIVEDTLEAVRKAPAFEPSMLQDRLTGHLLEVDIICGQVVRIGQAIGVQVPNLLAVAQELESINEAQRETRHNAESQGRMTPASAPNGALTGFRGP